MRLSQRSRFPAEENALSKARAAACGAGRTLIDLTVSNPTVAQLPYASDAILDALGEPSALRYEPLPFGLPAARTAVAAAHDVDPARVVLTASTSEAYSFLLKVLCDPGDRVLSPQPSYPLLAHLAALEGVGLCPYTLRWDGRWHVDSAQLRDATIARPRAVLAVSPNNPTGSVLDADDLAALDRTELPLVVDEVFASYPLEGVVQTSYATNAPRIVVGGLSKLAGLPQMKVGWILVGGDARFAGALLERLEVVADAFLSTSTPAQLALPRWLETRHTVVDAIRARTRENLETLRGLAGDDSPITVPRVEAGWYACLRVPETRSCEQWALGLLEDEGVLCQPGYFYDFVDGAWLVLSLLTPKATFHEGAERLVRYVAASV